MTALGVAGVNPRYGASGYVFMQRADRTVFAVPFDAEQLRVTGPSVTALEGGLLRGGGVLEYDVAADGTLVYVEGQSLGQLMLVDRAGAARPLVPALGNYGPPRVSPVSGRVVYDLSEQGSPGKGAQPPGSS